jgi:hypothetical protein
MIENDETDAFANRNEEAGSVTDLLKSATGEIHFPSSLFDEVLSLFRSSRRTALLDEYIGLLRQHLGEVSADQLSQKLRNPYHRDLFEEGVLQAVAANSHERKKFIARIVAGGILGDPSDSVESKNLLQVLVELTDEQVVFLLTYLNKAVDDQGHSKSQNNSTDAVRSGDPAQGARDKLDRRFSPELMQSLGLLNANPLVSGQNISGASNADVAIASTPFNLSSLGRTLLMRIGLAEARDS